MCARMMEGLPHRLLLVVAPGAYGNGAAIPGGRAIDTLHSLQLSHLPSIKVSLASSQFLLPHHPLSLLPPHFNSLALALHGNPEISSIAASQLPAVAVAADPGGPLQQFPSVADVVKTLSSSPMQGSRLGEFLFVSAGLILLFWLGNYVVPDILLKRMTNRDENTDQSSSEKNDGIQNSLMDRTDGSNSVLNKNSKASRTLQEDTSKSDRTLGFGSSTKQTRKPKKGRA